METLNTIQRDFRKVGSKLTSLLEQAPDDPVVVKCRKHLLVYRPKVKFLVHKDILPLLVKQQQRKNRLFESCDIEISLLEENLVIDPEDGVVYFLVSPPEYLSAALKLMEEISTPIIVVGADSPTVEDPSMGKSKSIFWVDSTEEFFRKLANQEWFLKELYREVSRYYQNTIAVVQKVLRRKAAVSKGSIILNQSREIESNDGDLRKLQRHSIQVKQQLSNLIKDEFAVIESSAHDYFNPEGRVFRPFFDQITHYRGFDERDDSRNTLFSIPKDYIEVVKNRFREQIDFLVSQLIERLDVRLQSIQKSVDIQMERLQISDFTFTTKAFTDDAMSRTLEREASVIKEYEKKVPKKGIYQLLMELRTPLYIIFPLFIIARFISTSDKGAIDHSVSSLAGEAVVVVSKMPDSYNRNMEKFVGAVNKHLNDGDLVNESTGQEIFKYTADIRSNRKSVVYSYLENDQGQDELVFPVHSDRDLAIELLEHHVLNITRRFNVIAELQRIPAIFGPFRSFFGPVMFILVLLYMYSRKEKMKNEKLTIRGREQKALLDDFKKDICKLAATLEATFQNQLRNYQRSYSDEVSQFVDQIYQQKVSQEENRKVNQVKIIRARDKNFQSEIKQFDNLGRQFQEIQRECVQLLR